MFSRITVIQFRIGQIGRNRDNIRLPQFSLLPISDIMST
jgi:hypothetical protein